MIEPRPSETIKPPTRARPRRLLILLLATQLIGLLAAVSVYFPPAPREATSGDLHFSALRAHERLAELMAGGRPHPVGSDENRAVRSRIVAQLEDLGYQPHIQSRFVCSSYRHYCGTVHNVLARYRGADNSSAVILNAHYDTQPATPGASDCMAGVASALEVARILARGPQLQRDVIFLFNDGEEAGLLGSTAFVEEHEWAEQVVAAVNLEARGSAGPSVPAYTIGNDRELLALHLSDARRPSPGSAFLALTRFLPLDNDLSIFDQLGIPGVTFGYARHPRHYHSQRDQLERVSLGSLQQHGENALRLTRALANRVVDTVTKESEPNEPAQYFSIGPLALAMPAHWSWLATSAAAALLIAAAFRLARRTELAASALAVGSLFPPLTILVAFFGSALVNHARTPLTDIPSAMVSNPLPTFVGFCLLGTGFTFGLARLCQRWLCQPSSWLGLCGWSIAAAFMLCSVEPRASYLFYLPALAGAVCCLLGSDRPERSLIREAALAVPAAITTVIWYPHLTLLLDLLGLGNLPPVASLTAIAAVAGAPLLRLGSGRVALMLLTLGVLLIAIGTRLPTFSAEHPQYSSLVYQLDNDASEARWIVTGTPVPAGLRAAGGFEKEWGRAIPWSPLEAGLTAEAPALDIPGPRLALLDLTTEVAGTRARARLVSQRGAPVVQMAFPAEAAPLRVSIEGVQVRRDQARFERFDSSYRVYTVWTTPSGGVEVEMLFSATKSVEVTLADRSYDLPSRARPLLQARPETAAPNGFGDGTIVVATSLLDLQQAPLSESASPLDR